ncbi:MAG: hypothetical protein GC200_07070 [Tepidisphaera sp.]|nr:hypothetical protein [Tepidisphaera sp.]
MNERTHASRISRELDDQKSPGAATPAPQRLVHRALSRRESQPWLTPPAKMREDILNAVSESTSTPIPLELPRLRPTPWGLLTAASVLAALGVGVLVGLRLAPLTQTPRPIAQAPVVSAPERQPLAAEAREDVELAEGPTRTVVDPLAFVPSATSGSPERYGIAGPLRGEVSRMSLDAKRTLGTLLKPLPWADE